MLETKPTENATFALSATPNKTVVITNPTNKTLFTWVHSTVSYAKGELQEADALNQGAIGRLSHGRVLKKWNDGSVCLLALKTATYLAPGAVDIFEVGSRPNVAGEFQWHPDLAAHFGSGALASSFHVQCESQGQTLTATPFTGTWKALHGDPSTLAYRFRTHFVGGMPAVSKELSCTIYAEAEALSPIVKLTVVLGNDTLERPIAGGIEVSNFRILNSKPGVIQNEQSYQGKSCWLADGQQVAFKYFFNCSTEQVFTDTMQALAECEIVGLQSYEGHKASKGLMTHFTLPNQRFPQSELLNVHNQVNAQNAAPLFASPKTNIWGINQNPASTGDQGDFGAGHPMTKVLQSYSLRLFNRHFVGVLRESFRPSHYWENGPNGLEYCSLIPYISLFFWSGRPHWHPTWNPEYPAWQARGALNMGPNDNWWGQDNQHMSNNNLRAVYELTGNWYLRDLCHSYCSVTYWNFFTKWANNTEAERCTRTMKEAYALAELFSDTPEGEILMNAVLVKAGVYDQEVTAKLAQYNVPAVAPFSSCDPRVNNAIWCAPYPGDTIVVAWQTGFHLEWEFTRAQSNGSMPDLRYLMYASTYFANDGGCKTYFPLPNPPDATYGGIGNSWWAGWLMLAEAYKNEPAVATQCQFILSMVKPHVEADINQGLQGYFSGGDRWKAWD